MIGKQRQLCAIEKGVKKLAWHCDDCTTQIFISLKRNSESKHKTKKSHSYAHIIKCNKKYRFKGKLNHFCAWKTKLNYEDRKIQKHHVSSKTQQD